PSGAETVTARGLRVWKNMKVPLESVNSWFNLFPLADVVICAGIILAIGLFLWNKGGYPVPPKR
nr:hypothetical protein [bacterium]